MTTALLTRAPAPNFDHLLHMSDERGTFEHARLGEPRPEHGYCTDDMARVLVVATRQPRPPAAVRHLAEMSLRFLSDAQGLDGDYRNRMDRTGHWLDRPALQDCWGRSLWALGTAVSHSSSDWVRQAAMAQFTRAAGRRSPWPRAMAYATLGAAEVLAVDPANWDARLLVSEAADAMAPPRDDQAWPWPEDRLAYANAVLPEAMIAAGAALARPALVRDGLAMLAWLARHETRAGHLSVTPVGGAGADDVGPGFDQQPIEVAALADACARASTVDDDPRWADTVDLAVAWFLGRNDSERVMWDPLTGGGFDGLELNGTNLNQGTESTLALLSTLQHGRQLPRRAPNRAPDEGGAVSVALTDLVRRSPQRLSADPSRVVTQLFVPGQEGFDHRESRASRALARILALDEEDVERAFADVVARFGYRHRDIEATFLRHADELADRLGPRQVLSPTRQLLLGATFTSEYALEGAALCNPCVVAHPDQTGVPVGALRFIMSVRAIGEGHRSSIGFRTGVVGPDGEAQIERPSPFATTGEHHAVALETAVFHGELDRLGRAGESARDYVLDALGESFSAAELEEQLDRLQSQLKTRQHGMRVITLLRRFAERAYGIRFAPNTSLSERVLRPAMHAESHGLEDARFVRFDDDGDVSYYGTYTAYDGDDISLQLLHTTDFTTFTSSPIVGPAAANKGLALFPRRVNGRFAALSRADRETNAVAFSANLSRWGGTVPCQAPSRSWEVLQLGNCGSPIETDGGWLVLTHGVGPMRTYSIGAILLDLADPTKVLGQLDEPLLGPTPEERDGYVPNVVYSCGALVHAGTLLLPYGISDSAIGIATVPLADLLEALGSSRC